MLKFLLIVLLIGFLFFKIFGLFFRVLLGGQTAPKSNHRSYQNHQSQSRRSADGNVNIDYVPNDSNKSQKAFKGGEYVDYEEIN